MCEHTPLQDRLHPDSGIRHCYGCGANNEKGLRIKTVLEGDEGVSLWVPEPHHCSYPGYLNGGIAATLIDCHSAWTAFAIECRDRNLTMGASPDLPTGWTKAMNIEFLRPAPLGAQLVLRAKVIKKGNTSRTVQCVLSADGAECVRAEVVMVMVDATKGDLTGS